MNDIATISHTQTMSSLQIAELTGKQHKDVMRAIRNMEDAWERVNGRKFALVEYTDAKGEKRPCYNLTKTECLYIATKFNDEARAKLVLRWEELEASNTPKVPTTFKEALLLAAAQQEQIEKQQKQISAQGTQIAEMSEAITEMLPKVSYYDKILASKELVTTTQIAADYGMSAQAMNNQLRDMGIQRKVNGQWILRQPYISRGYAHSKPVEIRRSDGTLDTKMSTQWRQSGRLFIYNELKNKGILPLIER